MFSVDNFYSYMQSTYGWQPNRVVLYKHITDGSKNIRDIQPYLDDVLCDKTILQYSLNGRAILHDQEPFDCNYIDTYRNYRFETNNFQNTWTQMLSHELLLHHVRACSWPIFCHSEKNSVDIKWLENHGFITCHYLWHGLIARDWFRHWKHHPGLKIQNRSRTKRFLLYASGKTGSREYRKKLIDDLVDLKHEILYDWDEQKNVSSDSSAQIDVNDAVKTAVHIVAETVFDRSKIHATEKVFKPMVMRQPFIVFAGAGMLGYLRSYGFKTFESVWDESYDLEEDHEKRFYLLIKLIKQLSQLSESDFESLLVQCNEIIEHNHRHFFSEQFESVMMEELDQNLTAALAKQTQLEMEDPGGSFFYVVNRLLDRGVDLTPGMKQQLDYLGSIKDSIRIQKIRDQYPWFDQWCRPNLLRHQIL